MLAASDPKLLSDDPVVDGLELVTIEVEVPDADGDTVVLEEVDVELSVLCVSLQVQSRTSCIYLLD